MNPPNGFLPYAPAIALRWRALGLILVCVAQIVAGAPAAGPLPQVSIVPVTNTVEGATQPGLFEISRTGPTNTALSVSYTLNGSATPGMDFIRLGGAAVIPAGQFSVRVAVAPLEDADAEPPESVELALTTAASPFTLVALPDTQVYVRYGLTDLFISQTRWIVENQGAHNIAFVLHEGDCTDLNTVPEWINVKRAMSLLDGVVPYAIAPGNHDGVLAPPDTTLFNQYFPLSDFTNRAGFGGVFEPDKLDNSFHTFNAGGLNWLALALEFGPRDEVLAWANGVVSNHPNHLVVLVIHTHVYSDDTLHGSGPHPWVPTAYGRPNDPPQVWDKLIRRHANFRFVFNGHVLNDGAGRVVGTNDAGRAVYQILANYQTLPDGGHAYLRLMEFIPAEDKFTVRTYSPHFDRYLVDPQHEFEYDGLGLFHATNATYTIDPGHERASLILEDNDRDTAPPAILLVESFGLPSRVKLTFSEPVDPATATNAMSYALDGASAFNAITVSPDGRVATLWTISQLTTGMVHSLAVNGVRDVADPPNVIAPGTTMAFEWQPLLLAEGFGAAPLSGWTVVDQGDREGPSLWAVRSGRLEQSANVHGPTGQSIEGRLGTFAFWNAAEAFGWSDYTLAASITTADDDGVGLLARYQNPSNYFKIELDRQAGFSRLTRTLDGVETLLASQAGAYSPGQTLRLAIDANGDELRVHLNGGLLFGGTVLDASLPAGSVALYCWASQGVAFDDVTVTPAGFATPPARTNHTASLPYRLTTLVPINAAWMFWSFDDPPAPDWASAGFDDGVWPGPNQAILAREPDALPEPVNTSLSLGPVSFYFRRQFIFAEDTNGTALRLQLLLDDGAVVYLNGTEVFRHGMPPGPLDHFTTAARDVGNAVIEGPFDLPATNLVAGTNVLAVSVHQSSFFSEDVVFGLELEAQTPLAQPAWLAPPRFVVGGLLRLEIHGEPGRAYTVEASANLTDWTPFLTRTNQEQTRIVFEVPHTNGARRFFRVATQQ